MSTITVINQSDEVVRIAIYKKPVLQPTLSSIAWRVISPPPQGGQTVVQIPSDFAVFANYSNNPAERNDPNAGNRTNTVSFAETTARFIVDSVSSQDEVAEAAIITQSFKITFHFT